MGKFLLVVIIFIIAIVLMLGGGIFFLTQGVEHKGSFEVPLPKQIGGSLTVKATVFSKLDIENLGFTGAATLSLDQQAVNHALPIKEFSMLVGEVDSAKVASMLGRMNFISDSATMAADGQNVVVVAGLTGEFFVRERRQYAKDAEQPESGVVMPFQGTVELQLESVGLDHDWQLQIGSRTASFRLDTATRNAWRNRFGAGDEFAELVEGIFIERANNIVAQLETDSRLIRTQFTAELDDVITRNPDFKPLIDMLQITSLEIDNCPTVDTDGTLSLWIGGNAYLSGAEGAGLKLPDLTIRPGPCT